ALSEVIRQALYLSNGATGGRGSVDQLCHQLEQEGDDGLDEFAEMAAEDLERLRVFCKNRARDTGPRGVGIDALDGFSMDQCVSGDADQVEQAADVAQLFMDCYKEGGGATNPLAIDGSDTA